MLLSDFVCVCVCVCEKNRLIRRSGHLGLKMGVEVPPSQKSCSLASHQPVHNSGSSHARDSSAVSHGHDDDTYTPYPIMIIFLGNWSQKKCVGAPPPPPRLFQGWRKLWGSRSSSETFCSPPPPPSQANTLAPPLARDTWPSYQST